MLSDFRWDGERLLYLGKLCIPRAAVSTILLMAHDANTAGHFGYTKTMSRLDNYHWRYKSRDVKKYVQSCLVCQKKKNYGERKLTEPTSLEFPERTSGSLATDLLSRSRKPKMDLIVLRLGSTDCPDAFTS